MVVERAAVERRVSVVSGAIHVRTAPEKNEVTPSSVRKSHNDSTVLESVL